VHLRPAQAPGEGVHRVAALGVVEDVDAGAQPVGGVGEAAVQLSFGLQLVAQRIDGGLEA